MLSQRNALVTASLLVVGTIMLIGCSSDGTVTPAQQNRSSQNWKQGLDADVVTALSELTDADREAALVQEICPVTGKQLGSMGAPVKVTVKEKEVFLCCAGCEDKIKNNPDEYLSKLNDK